MKNQNHILSTIAAVYEQAKGSELDDKIFKQLKPQLKVLSKYLHCKPDEAFFMATMFSLSYEERYIDVRTLKDYFKCNSHKVLAYNKVFENLRNKKMIKIIRDQRSSRSVNENDYLLNHEIADCIVQGKPVSKYEPTVIDNPIKLLEAVHQLEQDLGNDEISRYDLKRQFSQLIDEHKKMPLLQKIDHLKLEDYEKYFFLNLAWETAIVGQQAINAPELLEIWFEGSSASFLYMQTFINEDNLLIKHDLVKLENDAYLDNLELKVSDHGKAILQESGIKLLSQAKKKKNVIMPKEIKEKKLLYNDAEKKQITRIHDALKPKKLLQIQEKLEEKGLSKGIVVLLHGEPGTGKTETVYQLAKSTKRAIAHVDISNSKSMWFGESEKIIKSIFTKYMKIAESEERFPILLFNEADAILSKRTDVEMSNISRTENTIQNILLEQLENFQGILIATTNLTKNIDPAFERRFLFKIQMHKPTTEARAHIWKMKFPKLKKSDCQTLATQFNFSGGQIDNILKKATMEEVIQGKKPTAKQLEQYCREETLDERVVRKVGFG